MRWSKVARIGARYAKKKHKFKKGQRGWFFTRFAHAYTQLYVMDPTLVDSKAEIRGIVDALFETVTLPTYD